MNMVPSEPDCGLSYHCCFLSASVVNNMSNCQQCFCSDDYHIIPNTKHNDVVYFTVKSKPQACFNI